MTTIDDDAVTTKSFMDNNELWLSIIEQLEQHATWMEECLKRIYTIVQMYPPRRDENKFHYGKLIEKILIYYMNEIVPCRELDLSTPCGSHYLHDVEFISTHLRASIKVSKNGSAVTLVNKRTRRDHNLENTCFLVCNLKTDSLYFIVHQPDFSPFLRENGASISYTPGIFRFIEQAHPHMIFQFTKTVSFQTFQHHMLPHVPESNFYEKEVSRILQLPFDSTPKNDDFGLLSDHCKVSSTNSSCRIMTSPIHTQHPSDPITLCDDPQQPHVDMMDTESSTPPTLRFIDLFCGIGGFHVAMTRLGKQLGIPVKCVFASDIDKGCREIYVKNFGIEPMGDIQKVETSEIPDFDVLCAGFPCQPFSNGGQKRTFQDSRGLLFDHIIRIVQAKKPRFLFLENVKHILKVDNQKVIAYIRQKLAEVGYHHQEVLISPHVCGIPQQRERVYFIGIRRDVYANCTNQNSPFQWDGGDAYSSLSLPKDFHMSSYLETSDDVCEKYTLSPEIRQVLDAWDELIQQFEPSEVLSPTILIHDAYRTFTEEEWTKRPLWKKDYMEKNRRLLDKYRPLFDTWYRKHRDLLQKREIYGKLEWQAGPLKADDSIYHHFIQIRQSGIRVKKSRFFPTLVAISQIPIYGPQKRYITPRECARLQSFPDDFILHISDRQSYKQLGNSINVQNATDIIQKTLSWFIYS